MTTMKTPISKTILSIIGLLATGAIAFAQTGDDSCVLRRPNGANFYVEASASYIKEAVKLADTRSFSSKSNNLYGGSAAFGWRINSNNKLQIELGAYASSASQADGFKYPDDYHYDGRLKFDFTAIPLLVSYSYCVPLIQNGRGELCLTPVAGAYFIRFKQTSIISYIDSDGRPLHYESHWSKDSGTYAAGVGASFVWHFTSRFYASVGYRFLYRGSLTIYDKGYSAATHWATLAAGWKF